MIYPRHRLTISQRLFHVSARRKRRTEKAKTTAVNKKLGMKYNMKNISYRDDNGVLQTL